MFALAQAQATQNSQSSQHCQMATMLKSSHLSTDGIAFLMEATRARLDTFPHNTSNKPPLQIYISIKNAFNENLVIAKAILSRCGFNFDIILLVHLNRKHEQAFKRSYAFKYLR